MREERRYFVYIMSNPSRTLYTGITNSLRRRVHEHKLKAVPGFTSKYNIPGSSISRVMGTCGTQSNAKNK